MIEIENKCTACGACVSVCPKQCISLKINDRGYLYPHVFSDICIDCHACERICHLNANIINANEPIAFAVRCNNMAYLNKSTSGGAFSAIAEYILNNNGIVYGCAYVNHLKAKHIRIDSLDKLYLLNGSKYVQSDCSSIFTQIKDDLNSNRLTLFSGTPCQVAALKSFIGNRTNRLITVDIVCHGVTSQHFFDKYIEWYEKKNNFSVVNYDFRSKENAKWSLAGVCLGESKNKKRIKKKIYYYNEFYYFYFLKGMAYRESCYECKYANLKRPGDITLGDMWGAETLGLDYDTTNGCSLYLANSEQGLKILDCIDVNKHEITIDQAIRLNTQLTAPSKRPLNYEDIIELITLSEAEEIDSVFRKTFKKERFIGFVKYHIPGWVKTRLKRIIQ